MSVSPNINFGLAPLQSPITDGSGPQTGIPFQNRATNPVPAGVLNQAWQGWFNQLGKLVKQLPTISDVAANMVPTGGGAAVTDWTPDAWKQFAYYQTDTGLLYISMIVNDAWEWVYAAGAMTVALLSDLPTTFGPLDTGAIVYELEFLHAYQWTGSAWRFLPGDPGAGYIVATVSGAPIGGAWALCDGTAADISQGDGTKVSTTTPNLMTRGLSGGPVLIGGGGSGFQAATTPQWQTGAVTDNESTHTHPLTNATVQSGSGATVAAAGSTGAGTAHNHGLSDANAKLKAPSDGSDATHGGGMPDRFYLEWYVRQ